MTKCHNFVRIMQREFKIYLSLVSVILNLRKAKTTLDSRELKQPRRQREGKRHFIMTSQSFKLLRD